MLELAREVGKLLEAQGERHSFDRVLCFQQVRRIMKSPPHQPVVRFLAESAVSPTFEFAS